MRGKEKMKRFRCIAALVCLLLFFCAGCGSAENADAVTQGVGSRYAALTLPFPEGCSMPPCGAVLWEGDRLFVAAETLDPADGSNGAARERKIFCFSVEADGEAALLSAVDLPVKGDSRMVAAAFSGDSVWIAAGGTLLHADRSDGSLLSETPFDQLPGMPADFSPERMAADGDGDLWLAQGDTVLVYSPEFDYVNTVKTDTRPSSLAVDPDGRVWAAAGFGKKGERGALRLNKETGGYENAVILDGATEHIAFSPDGALYFDTRSGVRVIRVIHPGGNASASEAALDFTASGIVWAEGGDLISGEGGGDRSELIAANDGVLLFQSVTHSGRQIAAVPVLYAPAGDLPADDGIVTVKIAYAHEVPSGLNAAVVRFNAEHPEIRIEPLDYTDYDSGYDMGAQRLLIDMTTGLVSPDIVVGMSDSLEIATLARKHRTADLTPYLSREEELNPENIFGLFLHYFDDGEGGLWGYAPSVIAETWVSSRELLGEFGSDDGWSLGEYMDFAASLPPGRFLSGMYGARGVNSLYLPGAFESFVDLETGTCSFDSPLFERYLAYLDGLPEQKEIARVRPEIREHAELTRMGFYALDESRDLYGMGAERLFNTRDYVIVGYPSDNPAGRVNVLGMTYVMPDEAAHKEEAWAFLREVFLDEETRKSLFSPLKSDYDAEMEEMRGRINLHFADGSWTTWNAPPKDYGELADTIKELFDVMNPGVPFTVEPPDEEQIARVRSWLDSAGGSAIDLLPPEVNELIREEISAYLGGVGTAESCAAAVQSRVSLWLAENR